MCVYWVLVLDEGSIAGELAAATTSYHCVEEEERPLPRIHRFTRSIGPGNGSIVRRHRPVPGQPYQFPSFVIAKPVGTQNNEAKLRMKNKVENVYHRLSATIRRCAQIERN